MSPLILNHYVATIASEMDGIIIESIILGRHPVNDPQLAFQNFNSRANLDALSPCGRVNSLHQTLRLLSFSATPRLRVRKIFDARTPENVLPRRLQNTSLRPLSLGAFALKITDHATPLRSPPNPQLSKTLLCGLSLPLRLGVKKTSHPPQASHSRLGVPPP